MKIDTQTLHAGFTADPTTGATAVPVYQTTAYAYPTAEEVSEVFGGRAPGYIYTRIANPTSHALERRLAEIEGGIGCIATSSGMAAIASVMMGLLRAGDEILCAAGIFGGTVSLFQNTLGRFGVTTKMVDLAEPGNVSGAIGPTTKVIFIETIGNPRLDVPDIPAIARLARERGIPLVVDSTLTTPALVRPGQWGADIVVHSTTKFINGHGTAVGGAIIDTGQYDWSDGIFADLRVLAKKAGPMAFLAHLRNTVWRDLGGCPAPMNSFLMLQGLETLGPRMGRHCENAEKLAQALQRHPKVAWVNYPALPESPFRERVDRLYGGRGGGVLTFGLGGRPRAFRCINALKLARNLANLGDAKTLVIHPASTIFHEYDAEQRSAMGVPDDLIRVSVGLEDFEDIRNDFENAIERSTEQRP